MRPPEWLTEPTSSNNSTGDRVVQGHASYETYYEIEIQLQIVTELRNPSVLRIYLWESFLRTYWPFITVKCQILRNSKQTRSRLMCPFQGKSVDRTLQTEMQRKAPLLEAWVAVHYSSSKNISQCDLEPQSVHVSACTKHTFPVSTKRIAHMGA